MKNSSRPSNRKFGLLFSVIFMLLSAYSFYHDSGTLKTYCWLSVSVTFGLAAVSKPDLLTPLNRSWMMLGDLMSKVTSPLVLGLIFFALISPIALLARLFGRDELRLKRMNTNTYWIDRIPPGPSGDSFNNQF